VRTSTRARWRVSAIWIIPAVALVVGAWLAWDTLAKRGPIITITFQSAEGLSAGQSPLKYKDITFGTVRSFALEPDKRRVRVTVETTREAAPLLTDGAVFWVVKPRLFAGSISGLETLLSGAYIQMRPAAENGAPPRYEFTGLEDPPVLTTEVPGRTFLLKAARIGSISLGSPVFFRDMAVGEVLGWDVGDMAEHVTIHAFVRAPFDRYVHDDSRFWNVSGLSVKLGGAGVQVELESLRALLLGGLAFETPDRRAGGKDGAQSAENHVFELYPNQETAQAAGFGQKIELVAYFDGSVRGLTPGSDVTLHGLKVGTVGSVSLTYDRAKDRIVAPVHFVVEPERIRGIGERIKTDPAGAMDLLVERGLRASLQSANLLTGQMNVGLQFVPDAPAVKVTREGDAFVIPTTNEGGIQGLQDAAAELLAKVKAIPFEQIGKNLDATVQGLSQIANSPELHRAVGSLSVTMANLQDTVRKLDAGLTPAMQRLPALAADLQKTVGNANRLVESLQSGYGDNTRFNRDLERLMAQLNDTVRSLGALADLLQRHPEALIRGRTNTGVQ